MVHPQHVVPVLSLRGEQTSVSLVMGAVENLRVLVLDLLTCSWDSSIKLFWSPHEYS